MKEIGKKTYSWLSLDIIGIVISLIIVIISWKNIILYRYIFIGCFILFSIKLVFDLLVPKVLIYVDNEYFVINNKNKDKFKIIDVKEVIIKPNQAKYIRTSFGNLIFVLEDRKILVKNLDDIFNLKITLDSLIYQSIKKNRN